MDGSLIVIEKKKESVYSFLMFVVAIIWGFGFIATIEALNAGYSTPFILMLRFLLAAVVFFFLALKDFPLFVKRDVTGGVLGGIFLFLGFALQTYGLPLTTPSNNAMITASSMVFIPFLTWKVFKKKPSKRIVIGSLVCFLGILVLSVNFKELGGFGKGDLLSFLCAISFALHAVTVGYFALHGNGSIINFIQMLVAGIFGGILLLLEGDLKSQLQPNPAFIWVAYLAVFSTIVAYFIQTAALTHLAPPRVAIISAFESVAAAIFSLTLGYETLSPTLLVGGSLVVGAVLAVEWPAKVKNSISIGDSQKSDLV